MNIEKTELAIEHAASAFSSGLKALLHFLAANSTALGQAAQVAEVATGNANLTPLTDTVSKTVQAAAMALDNIEFK